LRDKDSPSRLRTAFIQWCRPKGRPLEAVGRVYPLVKAQGRPMGALPLDFKGTGLEGQGQPFKAHCGVSAGVVPTPRGAGQWRPPFGPLPLE